LGGEAEKKLKPEEAKKYDILVFYDMYQQCAPYLGDLQSLLEQGKGTVFLHHALGSCSEDLEYGYMLGGKARFDSEDPKATLSHFKAGTSYRAHIEDPSNPITAGMGDFDVTDEVYSNYFIDTESHVIVTTDNPNSGRQLAWTWQYKKSRVVYIQLGHDHVTYENPNYRKLVERSIPWVSGRLAAPVKARIAPEESSHNGEQLYEDLSCSACHGKDARGGRGPDLHSAQDAVCGQVRILRLRQRTQTQSSVTAPRGPSQRMRRQEPPPRGTHHLCRAVPIES
jgi:type 1 glutamine amidotransferase